MTVTLSCLPVYGDAAHRELRPHPVPAPPGTRHAGAVGRTTDRSCPRPRHAAGSPSTSESSWAHHSQQRLVAQRLAADPTGASAGAR